MMAAYSQISRCEDGMVAIGSWHCRPIVSVDYLVDPAQEKTGFDGKKRYWAAKIGIEATLHRLVLSNAL
ncbi:hypothetical protein ACUHMQ_02365 [Chitinimonas sp. PSY-7]|uniref:hypothetical protein n=1 Tax=Chitinimonas sp. PSY-7 TaxID=3459088 RepID=UPI00403FF463